MRFAHATLLVLIVPFVACSSARDDDAAPAAAQALGVADLAASATTCRTRFASLGDPSMNPSIAAPVVEACRAQGGIEYVPFVVKELATLWGNAPSKLCTWLPGDASAVCDPSVTPANNAFYCTVDGSMAYDVPFVRKIEAQHGKFAAAAVFAHEWGHLNQHHLGLMPAQPPVRWTIQNELNADCQAGMFMALEQLLSRPLTQGDAYGAYMNFCSLGDDALGNPTPWFHPQAHGSCQQRAEAFARGYQRMLEYGSLVCAPTGADAMGRPTGLNAIKPLCDP